MVNRNLKLSLIVFVVLLVNTSFILALAVNSPYYNSNPLKAYAGQEKEIVFDVYNCPSMSDTCDKEDIVATVLLEEGSEIAEITSGSSYNLDFGDSGKIKMKISIPSNAAMNEEYLIRMTVQSVPKGDGVRMGVKYNVEFPVIVTDASNVPEDYVPNTQTKSENTNYIFLIIILIIVIMILIIVFSIYKILYDLRKS